MAETPPSLAVLRLQLEGRWEHIERARERYDTLTRYLSSFQWKRHLRSQPALLSEAREQEAELDEVLAYVEHRARRERWPGDHPALGILRELRTQRARLTARVRERLARSPREDVAPLAEVLNGLGVRVLAPVPSLPGPDEPVLLEGVHGDWPVPGWFWLTPKRLLWRPWGGEPAQVRLDSLRAKNISLLPGGLGVRVEGAEGFIPATPARARSLAALLELCQRLRHLGHGQLQVRDVVTQPAYLHEEKYEFEARWGLSVFRPGYVAFLPARRPSFLKRCVHLWRGEVDRPAPEELSALERQVEELRQLPSAEFTKCLRELVHVRGGAFWPTTGIHRAPPGSKQEVLLQSGSQLLAVPDAGQHEELQRFLQHQLPGGNPPKPRKRRWWHGPSSVKVGIVLGLGLQYLSVSSLGTPGLSPLLNLIGHGLFSWACVRYGRANGHYPLLALVLSTLVCGPWVLLLGTNAREKTPTEPSG